MTLTRQAVAIVTLACAALVGVHAEPASHTLSNEPISPLPEHLALDPAKVAIGKQLFFDTRFSRDNKISCASCHDFSTGGADGRARSIGVDGRVGPINAPTVFNAGFNFRQLWNGRAESLERQLDLAIANPVVFDSTWQLILDRLSRDKTLVDRFGKVYPGGLTRANVANALALFERSLVTPSRFDAYLRGDAAAISTDEKQGYEKFKSYGCIACHQGRNVGGNMFQLFGVMRQYLGKSGPESEADLGRFLVTGRERDKHVFKVPSLRNVARTAPYFHNASARTLEQAVDVMFEYQLGRSAPQQDKALIVKFLKSLNGDPPRQALPGTAG